MDEAPHNSKTPFRFHLATLFVFVTIAAVIYAVVGRVGVDGLLERLGIAFMIGGIFAPLVELYYYWKREVDVWE
jgi:peptidoglycan biosynthesis protein MviN/MurJ (putative lipid II flippase)